MKLRETVKFFAPDVAYADARKYLPALLEKRGVDSAACHDDSLPGMDRGCRFFWYGRGDVDNRPCGVVFAGVIQTSRTPALHHGLQRAQSGHR